VSGAAELPSDDRNEALSNDLALDSTRRRAFGAFLEVLEDPSLMRSASADRMSARARNARAEPEAAVTRDQVAQALASMLEQLTAAADLLGDQVAQALAGVREQFIAAVDLLRVECSAEQGTTAQAAQARAALEHLTAAGDLLRAAAGMLAILEDVYETELYDGPDEPDYTTLLGGPWQ
jgi:hypothetical protein